MQDLRALLGEGHALIVVPPFAGLDRPSLAAHTLQACAARHGFRVSVFYASFSLAKLIGDTLYEGICFAPTSALLGERFFARSAYGVPPLGKDDPVIQAAITDLSGQVDLEPSAIRELETKMGAWADETAAEIAALGFRVVGLSTTFEQTAASVALINRIKQLAPETITLMGGANCEGEMAEGILSLPVDVDYVFSGESEQTFPRFLADVRDGKKPEHRIVMGSPCRELDAVPAPVFDQYFEHRNLYLPDSPYVDQEILWLPYEGSRGCWWGEKHHCTFCGINGTGMAFRERSADRVIQDIRSLAERYSVSRICMTDNIMPHSFFRTLVPRLAQEAPGLYIFYEQKANLTLEQVDSLARSGIQLIQPGIESLSTRVLKLMDKGVTARQNIALLRYSRAAGMNMNWNLLYGFPGDSAEDYLDTFKLIKLMRHLQPPTGLFGLSIDRFSPYFFASEKYGIRSVRPMPSYNSVLPDGADVRKVAYHFTGDYESGGLQDKQLVAELEAEITAWQELWQNCGDQPPALMVIALGEDQYMILDRRGIQGAQPVRFVRKDEAAAVLVARPMRADNEDAQWARSLSMAIEYEGWHIPLATAVVPVLSRFEKEFRYRETVPLPILSSHPAAHAVVA